MFNKYLNYFYCLFFIFLLILINEIICNDKKKFNIFNINNEIDLNIFVPHSPLIPCENLPMDFIICKKIIDLKGNETAKKHSKYGCTKFGGQLYEEVEKTSLNCSVLDRIECFGNRVFEKKNMPCIKYSGHYFLSALIYSILLGFFGIDRFYLGHTGTAAGKLLTLGGIGIWWVVDIVLLVTGHLTPEDGSNWMPEV